MPFAEIALPIPLRQTFVYRVPERLDGEVRTGVQVQVPFRGATKRGESEANAILDESKKDFKVTKKGLADCLKDWDPQTQMSKAEWAESCRTTLEYFPDGQ